jgi:cell division protein FtsI/penicillin-binding protein 2
MRTFYENDIRRRVKFLSFLLAAWGGLVAARLVQVQVLGHARARAAVLRQARDKVKIEPRRGNILDRNGVILASSLPSPSVAIRPVENETPAEMRDRVAKLKAALGLSAAEVRYVLGRLREGYNYTYVRKKVPEEDAVRVMALKLAGVELDPGTRRYYPLGALASHILGGMSLDGENRTGVEARYNDILQGEEGQQICYTIPGGRNYGTQIIKQPVPGRDIVLTIDATIQHFAERELRRAIAAHAAAWGSIVVVDPATGEILALANWPAYDPNSYPYPAEAGANRAVQASFEPGSTFKIVTAAAVRERNRVGYGELFDCSAGSIRVGGTTITDHDRFGVLSFPQVLIHSSNVGTVRFAQRLSIAEYYQTIKTFGFGQRTGIDMPREDSGRVWPPESWTKSSLPHIAIGYEVRATPLQTLMAMNVFATGGLLVRPHVVKDGAGAEPAAESGASPVRVISEKSARELVDRVFAEVVEKGTAEQGRLDGFGVAGKTGTAQKYDDDLKTYTDKYTASFVGFTPLNGPRLSMIVVLDSPKEGYYGGQVCAPVFRDVAKQVLRYLRVPPERPLSARTLKAELQKGRTP